MQMFLSKSCFAVLSELVPVCWIMHACKWSSHSKTVVEEHLHGWTEQQMLLLTAWIGLVCPWNTAHCQCAPFKHLKRCFKMTPFICRRIPVNGSTAYVMNGEREGERLGVCVLLLLVNPVSSSLVWWTLPDLGGPQLRAEDQMAKHFALLECPWNGRKYSQDFPKIDTNTLRGDNATGATVFCIVQEYTVRLCCYSVHPFLLCIQNV